MAKQEPKTNLKSDEFTKIFDDYRARIDEITKKTTEKDDKNSKAKAQEILEDEIKRTKAEVAKSQPDSDIFIDEIEWQANKRAAEIIKEAKLQAQRLIYEAEDKIRKEAKKKTQAHIDKIIEKSRKESEEIIERAREIAEREKQETITTSRQDLEKLVREITEKAREETESQSTQILFAARENAEKMISDVVQNSKDISEKVMEIMSRTKSTVRQFQEELQSGLSELAEAVEDTQNKLDKLFVYDGTFVKDLAQDTVLVTNLDRDEAFEAIYFDQTVAVGGNIVTEVTLYAPQAQKLFVNGRPRSFSRSGDHITFDGSDSGTLQPSIINGSNCDIGDL